MQHSIVSENLKLGNRAGNAAVKLKYELSRISVFEEAIMSTKSDFDKMFEDELERRVREMEAIGPGTDKSGVKPLKPKEVLPALATMILIILLFIWITLTFYPKYLAS